MDEGHCGLPAEELTPLAVELLEVPGELIQTALDLELAERTVIADTVGEVAIAVHNVSGRRRWSKLNEWLAAPAGRQNNAS
jgi:hypothetical protein